MNPQKSVFNWSGGKDSSIALYHALRNGDYAIEQLLSTLNQSTDRLSMHRVRRALIQQQAQSIGIPLEMVDLPAEPSMKAYNESMGEVMQALKSDGFTHSIFGDIFLEDLRQYREQQSQKLGFEAVFPIWKRDTEELMQEFLDLDFKAITICVKAELLGKEFVGRVIDEAFVDDLPEAVDPCGENGEFHTFVYDGPMFDRPIPFEIGEKVYREYEAPSSEKDECELSNETDPDKIGFWFCDLVPEK
ncbi:diphthine--ammonia ligase [Gracilimonas mengyeensis]|uniref:MJ0570-related uncharacterized domain-containing protein n=1 Tax=Gracilimonas mengyeensis TaxID=1302730 RepID=A0A521APH4_9BACT|nr:diphthine--ammonia ligase [Gracilimonas mengyeensis]SMO36702.1 MJ0570-related uncharacterized domain-containing protein [Gracilimonas mengyeensis]